MKYFRRCLSPFLFLLLLISTSASAQYWERITTIPSAYQNTYWLDVYFLPSNSNYGWICGYNGHVIRTTDGGATWSGARVPYVASGSTLDGHLEGIHFASQNVGYTSGPTGFFKTVDGGATWSEIVIPQAAGIWGCYFLTPDLGVVVGGNCGTQDFFFTEDGGLTWTRSQLTVPNSKLSDCILYPDGSGVAAGSGRVFKTADYGRSWQAVETTGTNIWHEEISVSGNSILVPAAGVNCDGMGGGGGMRFFDGIEWRNFLVGSPLFGSFLLSPTSGWACGYNKAMYYTADAGRTWELRNCGILGSLDDVWFINNDLGWAVGGISGSGFMFGDVYKYSPSKRDFTKTDITFPAICAPALDTTWLVNKSFFPVIMQYSLSGDNEFSIKSPAASTVVIPACSSFPIEVLLTPHTAGPKAATLTVTFPQFAESVDIRLRGRTKKQESAPLEGIIEIKDAPVGKSTTATAFLKNQGFDASTITFVGRISGSAEITPQILSEPITIPAFTAATEPTPLNFSITPTDTGWIETRFRVQLTEPCLLDTLITVRAYGTSPIISGPSPRLFSTACNPEKYDTIPIRNTGNAPLIISSANIGGSPNFSITGWLRNPTQYPRIIEPGNADSIIVFFKATSENPDAATLTLINNDSTRHTGAKNPYTIALQASLLRPRVSSVVKEIDAGQICINEEATRTFYMRNDGEIAAVISDMLINKDMIAVSAAQNVILPGDSVLVTVIFNPKFSGAFQDSLVLVTEPCTDRTVIVLKATAIETKLAFSPKDIFKTIKTGRKTTEQITVESVGNTAAIITAIRLEPSDRTDMRLIQLPSPLPVLQPGSTTQFAVEFEPTKDTVFEGKIIVETAAQCEAAFEIPFLVRSTSTQLQFFESALFFSDEICVPDSSYDTLSFKNETEFPVTITSIEVPNDNYSIMYPTGQTLTVGAQELENIIVRYSFKNPSANDTLKITTNELNTVPHKFPLNVNRVETIRPQLTFKNLDMGNFRLDESRSAILEITNPGNYTQTITGIQQATDGSGFTISLPPLPVNILPGTTLQIPVQFQALNIDTISAVVKIASETLCRDTNAVSVIARVPKIQYPFTISIGDYYATPPDTVEVPVLIENSFAEAMVSAVSLKIRFEERLAYPITVFSNTQQPLPYAFKNGLFEIELDTNSFTKMPLGESGPLFTMHLLAMPSAPYITPLDIENIEITSRYETLPSLKDGSLRVEYCLPIMGFNLLPTFSAAVLSNSGNSLQCEIQATGEQEISFELIDVFGNSHSLKTEHFSKGASIIEIPSNEIPSGTYFLKAQSSTGAFERIKVTIVK